MFVPFILGAKLATIGATTAATTAVPVAATIGATTAAATTAATATAAIGATTAAIGATTAATATAATATVATATVFGVKVSTVLEYSAVAVGSAGLAYGAHKMLNGDPTEDEVLAENRPPPL